MLVNLEETIHLTDFSFIHFCQQNYGINRGIYNTIDDWFYKQGIDHILERRKRILSFLEFIQEKAGIKGNRYKFGHGGLKIKLEEYYFTRIEKTVSKIASNL